ncbi:MAG: VOC family protein [Pseudomonadota bacterium]
MAVFPEQRMSILTLGVSDMDAACAFYSDVLGLTPFLTEGITMYDMGGFVFGLWEREKLHEDIGMMGNSCPPGTCPNFAIAYNARSIAEVDEIFGRLRERKVEIAKEPHKADWGGYSGYFVDPEGNAWEVAYNPHWGLTKEGHVTLSKEGTA